MSKTIDWDALQDALDWWKGDLYKDKPYNSWAEKYRMCVHKKACSRLVTFKTSGYIADWKWCRCDICPWWDNALESKEYKAALEKRGIKCNW